MRYAVICQGRSHAPGRSVRSFWPGSQLLLITPFTSGLLGMDLIFCLFSIVSCTCLAALPGGNASAFVATTVSGLGMGENALSGTEQQC